MIRSVSLACLLGILFFAAPPAKAQSTADQCTDATRRLAELQAAGQVGTPEVQSNFAIWDSADCRAFRQHGQFNVAPKIAETTAFLKRNGIDIEARMQPKIVECRNKAPAIWLELPTKQRAVSSEREIEATCILNARTALYAEALNEYNRQREGKFAEDSAAYQRAKQEQERQVAEYERLKRIREAKIAADKADYERKQAEWRRAVALCNQGKREYCAPSSN